MYDNDPGMYVVVVVAVVVVVVVLLLLLLLFKTEKGSKERLFILTRTHSMQIFWEIIFIKPQNDT